MEDPLEKQNNTLPEENNGYHIALMGDSVLDDFYWLSDPRLDVRIQLESELKKKKILCIGFLIGQWMNQPYLVCSMERGREMFMSVLEIGRG